MSITVPQDEFVPAPAGLKQIVCVDVVDLGIMDTKKPSGEIVKKHKAEFVWELPDLTAEGARFTVKKRYNLSLFKNAKTGIQSSLRRDLTSWRGRDFTAEELKDFDLETLIGTNAQAMIIHNKSEDGTKTYANVDSLMPLSNGTPKLAPSPGYVRAVDREKDSLVPF